MLPTPTDRIFDMGEYRIHDPGGRVGYTLDRGMPYEWRLLYQIRSLQLSGSAFDVGAHVGNHALWLAAECGLKVHAWEPHAPSRALLDENLSLNPDLPVTVHGWAAGDRETTGRFTSGRWVSFDPQREGAVLAPGEGDIRIRRIDDHLYVDDLAVVKIDVEGTEPQVLAGMTDHLERCSPVVYCETHTGAAEEEIGAVLGPLGYKRTQTLRMGSRMDRWER